MNHKTKTRKHLWAALATAILIAFLPSIWLRYQAQRAEHQAAALQLRPEERERLVMARMAENDRSPETMQSPAMLFHQGLLYSIQNIHGRADLFFNALPSRFPDSPYNQKLAALRPLLEIVKREEDSPKIREARARLAIEALPLVSRACGITIYDDRYNSYSYASLNLGVSISPWWTDENIFDVTVAAVDSPHALWPLAASLNAEIKHNPYLDDTIPCYNSLMFGAPLKPDLEAVILAAGARAIPVLREHFGDPRLCSIDDKGSVYLPTTAGRLCYEIACQYAGFRFDDILCTAANSNIAAATHDEGAYTIRSSLSTMPTRMASPITLPRPQEREEVRAYFDRWWDECRDSGKLESLRWHIERLKPEILVKRLHYFSTMANLGARDEAIDRMHALHTPELIHNEFELAKALAALGDVSLLPCILENYLTAGSPPSRNSDILQLFRDHGSQEQRNRIVEKLQRTHNPDVVEAGQKWEGETPSSRNFHSPKR